VDLISKHIF